jgi:DNA modification methylase
VTSDRSQAAFVASTDSSRWTPTAPPTLLHGDCLDILPTLDAESIDAIVTDPPYGLGFMGKAWDDAAGPGDSPMRRRPEVDAVNAGMSRQGGRQWAGLDGQKRQARDAREYGAWCEAWASAMLRVAKPSAYLLAFGGTRTVHRMTVALEDAGWIIRDMLVWAYASGFPKSKASLKPAWEPIVMARKPGPLRDLAIDATRIATDGEPVIVRATEQPASLGTLSQGPRPVGEIASASALGRWPANVILTDPIFDGDTPGVVGGGTSGFYDKAGEAAGMFGLVSDGSAQYADSGTYSRFFLIPKASRRDREPVGHTGDRLNTHPTVKPVALMAHLVRLVTPPGGTVLDPFLGSGTTALACEREGFGWVGIEREAEYVAIAEARLNGTQQGLGIPA